jgi:hypothetical protein
MPIFSLEILNERKKMHHIELSEHSDETDAGVALARLKASRRDSSSNQLQTLEFCKRLRGYTYLNMPNAIKARLGIDPTPIPEQFGAVRVIDSRDGIYLGSVWQLGNGNAPARYGFAFEVKNERPIARELPSTLPGVLDLVVDIETRPRQTLFVSGTPFPDDIKDFMVERAPRRI